MIDLSVKPQLLLKNVDFRNLDSIRKSVNEIILSVYDMKNNYCIFGRL